MKRCLYTGDTENPTSKNLSSCAGQTGRYSQTQWGTRPLGIPCIKDRIVQMAVKLIIEPIFEAGFSPHSYGFRPKRSAHQALDDIKEGLLTGHIHVIDADLSKYFETY